METIHHHHRIEETLYFPDLEKKLGEGTLSGNIKEHTHFVPQIEEMEKWLKTVQTGKEQYDSKFLVEKVNSLSDIMIEHLNHVSNIADPSDDFINVLIGLGDSYPGVEQASCRFR